MEIPYNKLDPDTLDGLIHEVVTRDGTDYGETEVPPEERKRQVMAHLRAGKAVITFDPESGTCNILLKERLG
ncbi:hypothetical protein DENIS_3161 [Desulfonema ishimotonii]|uniref:YheU family protein n=1 Tax=Desulfonema ishimotonii TaxID=45657 RepID=A0A401FYX0_9BACT|nr:YheU family protein [Desulfonema ishimotonii]GBC62192.1 hypothetical protein DENIS_3161 [Desulfonema ishimotonii]